MKKYYTLALALLSTLHGAGWLTHAWAETTSSIQTSALPSPSDRFRALVQQDSTTIPNLHVIRSETVRGTELTEIEFTSQIWKGTPWTHRLVLIKTSRVSDFSKMTLVSTEENSNGNDGASYDSVRNQLTNGFQGTMIGGVLGTLRTPIAILNHVPMTPQFGIDRTNELIAYTFERYLETGDESWPILLPMTRAILKAEDVLQAYVQEAKHQRLEKFILVGGSKTAWASWLAAIHDPHQRTAGLVAAAFNVLNFRQNLLYQRELWGQLSAPLQLFNSLLNGIDQPADSLAHQRTQTLFEMVDPWYRLSELEVPKLFISGANDPYFPSDSDRFYWSELRGTENHRLYIPDFAHNASGGMPNIMSMLRILGSVSAFRDLSFDHNLHTPHFELAFQRARAGRGTEMTLTAESAPESIHFQMARSMTRDFRSSSWRQVDAQYDSQSRSYRLDLPPPAGTEGRYVAAFAEISWSFGNTQASLSETSEIKVIDTLEF